MAGLLDFYDDPRANMALAAGLLSGGNFGKALGRGMAGAEAAQLAAQERKLRESQAQENAARAKHYQDQQRQAQAAGQRDQQFQQALQQGVPIPELAKYFPEKVDLLQRLAGAPNFGRPTVARTVDVEGPGGAKMVRQLDQFGQPVGGDTSGYVAPQLINQGNRQTFAKPVAGQSFEMGQSPDSLASNAISIRGQNMTDARAREFNAISQQTNQLKLDEKDDEKKLAKANRVSSFDVMLGSLDRLGKHPGLSRSVGVVGAFPTMPGSESANFKAELDTFQSQAFIPMVSQLKGMGALSDAEGKKLTAAVGALSPSMGEKAFRESVARIKQEMENARNRLVGGPQSGGATGDFSGKAARVPVASGMYNGRKVIKYSDGSTDYAN